MWPEEKYLITIVENNYSQRNIVKCNKNHKNKQIPILSLILRKLKNRKKRNHIF